jgi:outer membrane lipoprotein SlyB
MKITQNQRHSATTSALLAVSLLAIFGLLNTGCKTQTRRSLKTEPSTSITLTEGTTLQYNYSSPRTANFFRKAYAAAEWTTNETGKIVRNTEEMTRVRNLIIDDLMGLIDQNYREYEVALRTDKNIKDLAFALAAMGLTAASTVAGGESTKTILSAIATGVLGANATIDKTLFKDLTMEALQLEMQRLRADRETVIVNAKKLSADDYNLNQAIRDLVEYYHAGFVTRALTSMVVETGNAAKDAKETADAARTPTK